WILIERWIPYPHLGARAGFNPFETFRDTGALVKFLLVRFYGLVILVPLIEEMFWRSFVLRYLTNPEWRSVAPWEYSLSAFGLMCAGFALVHSEWLAALICAAA